MGVRGGCEGWTGEVLSVCIHTTHITNQFHLQLNKKARHFQLFTESILQLHRSVPLPQAVDWECCLPEEVGVSKVVFIVHSKPQQSDVRIANVKLGRLTPVGVEAIVI